jgi:dihydrofolate synthase/folylpolyglutamate synthase
MTAPRPEPGWSLADWLRWLEQGARGAIHLGLERVQAVHARLGLRPRPTLTIAGTNGKGSCAHAADAMARALGKRTALYTSPHLLHFGERMRVNGSPAGEDAIVAALARVEAARGEVSLTYFEHATLAALCLFDEAEVDLQILEVGLGGRLDAVNIVDADVCVVTSIGLDHVRELGNSLAGIAAEKAGVARAGRPAVVAQHPAPEGLHAALSARGARILQMGALTETPQGWSPPGWGLQLPAPPAGGRMLRRNVAAAALALEAMGWPRPRLADALRGIVADFRLPGRLQTHRGLTLDVAHNAEAAAELAACLPGIAPRWRLVLGMMADKPVEQVARALAPLCERILCAPLPPPRGMGGEALARRLHAAGIAADHVGSVSDAIAEARAGCAPGTGILVTGSFLTVAAALQT